MLARHGPHHVAQKSTITGFCRRSEDLSGLPSSVFTVNDGAGRARAVSGATASSANASAVLALWGKRGEMNVECTVGKSSDSAAWDHSIGASRTNSNRKPTTSDRAMGDFSVI